MIVKQCAICGPLTANKLYKNGKCKICLKKYAIQWAKDNKDKRNETSKIWRNKNKYKSKIYRESYKEKNHAHKIMKDREYGKNYYKNHKEIRSKIISAKKKNEILNLHNTYVKAKVGRKFNIKASEVPLWMVEIFRPLIAIKRKIREIKGDESGHK